MHPARLPDETLLAECSVKPGRGSGPGGQHRNRAQTLVVLEHRPTGVRARAGERREQARNRTVALFRLRLALALSVRSEEPPEGPSALWRSRCRGGRLACNPRHRDFPSLIAEALDGLDLHRWEPRTAAELLGCSPSQLLKLIKDHPPAFAALNAHRERAGLHRLR